MEPVRPILINLLDTEKRSESNQLTVIISVISIMAILGLMGGLYAVSVKQLSAEKELNKDLKARCMRYQRSDISIQAQQKIAEGIAGREQIIKNIEGNRVSYLALLAEVEKASPEGIILYNVDIQTNKISISGKAHNQNQVAEFVAGLRASSWIKNTQNVTITGAEEDAALLTFDVQCDWEVVRQ